MGGATGKALGFPKAGEVIGATAGAAVDYSTGKMAKLMLDTARVARNPGVRGAAVIAERVLDRLIQAPGAEKYVALMDKLSERGPQAMMAAHQTLLKNDPEYAKLHAQQAEPAP